MAQESLGRTFSRKGTRPGTYALVVHTRAMDGKFLPHFVHMFTAEKEGGISVTCKESLKILVQYVQGRHCISTHLSQFVLKRACLSRDDYIVFHSIHGTVFVLCPFRRRRSLKHSEGVSLRVSLLSSRCTHCN